ncbi:YXWGXW repeat-containing protein [Pedobacter sp. N36a]|nr:YXWGXW repeat-containing protein [Pedobacter sp. N36a]
MIVWDRQWFNLYQNQRKRQYKQNESSKRSFYGRYYLHTPGHWFLQNGR